MIRAHTFSITNRGKEELKFLQSVSEDRDTYPLGYCILLFLPDGYPVTVGWIAKLLGKDRGHVGRVMKSLHRAGLVDCLYSKTRTSFGRDMITHLYRITELGLEALEVGPDIYLRNVRQHLLASCHIPSRIASRGEYWPHSSGRRLWRSQ
jgi:DNA-binding PadR family transcriptional regulator